VIDSAVQFMLKFCEEFVGCKVRYLFALLMRWGGSKGAGGGEGGGGAGQGGQGGQARQGE
jgi:hypothetical protein